MKHCITIYTDASWCFETKAGGWACWIKTGPGESALHSGQFKGDPVTCNEAEMMAIGNALAVCKKLYGLGDKIIVLVTDSQSCMRYMDLARDNKVIPVKRTKTKKQKKSKQYSQRLFDLAKNIRDNIPENCDLRLKKVQAHSNADGARSYVNRMVDQAAKIKMKEKRTSKQQGISK